MPFDMPDGPNALGDQWSLRDRAAAPVLDRIASDAERVPAPFDRLLRHLRDRLFDPELTVATLVRGCGYRSRATADGFSRVVGVTAKAYITARRVETAKRLIETTDLRIADIGSLVGIDDTTTFGRAFKRCFGSSPSAYRGRSGDAEAGESEGDEDAAEEGWPALLDRWRRLESATRGARFDHQESVRLRTQAVWNAARGLDADARRRVVVRAALRLPELVDLLAETSRVEGRGDRAWGVTMAELAVAAVPATSNGAWTVDRLAEARVRTRAWLGNAHRLALDFPAAQAAFGKAREGMERRPRLPWGLRAEVLRLEAGLYWYWSRLEEALTLADLALEASLASRDKAHIVKTYLRRAAILTLKGAFERSIADLHAAQQAMEGAGLSPGLALQTAFNLSNAYHEAGDLDRASSSLARASVLSTAFGDPVSRAHVIAMEGRLALSFGCDERAVHLLIEAAELFDSASATYLRLVFGLDLCLALARLGRKEAACKEARMLLPLFRVLGADRDLAAAVAFLKDGVRHQAMEVESALKARELVRRLEHDPGRRLRLHLFG